MSTAPSPRPIVAAVDFSPESERAARLAVARATRTGTTLYLAHVHPAPAIASSILGEPLQIPPELFERVHDHREESAAKLAKLAARLRASYPGVAVEDWVGAGDPADSIVDLAERRGAGLIVLATRGSDATRFLLGSVAAHVAQRASCPVLIVGKDAAVPFGGFRRVLCGIDESRFGPVVARLGCELVEPDGVVELIHAWQLPHFAWLKTAAERRHLQVSAERIADNRLETIGRDQRPTSAQFKRWVVHGSPASTLLGRAHDIGADLIVIGAHGRHGFERLFGTVADRVLRFAACSVLVVPGPALELEPA